MRSDINKLIFDEGRFFLVAGPCVVESEEVCMEVAEHLSKICDSLGIVYIFKSSFRKANRTRLDSFTGIGDKEALGILKAVGEKYHVPVLTDVHTENDVNQASAYVDVLQIPAFLSRQTNLLLSAGLSGLTVNIKKGQFMSAPSMEFAIDKVVSTGNRKIIVTERGNSFGYGDLIVDFRNIPIMKGFGFPVLLDASHAVQQPNRNVGVSGGLPQFIETLSKAGVAAGIDGLFVETHPEPSTARSDATNMLPLENMETLLKEIMTIRNVLRQ